MLEQDIKFNVASELAKLEPARLERMLDAGKVIENCYRLLSKTNTNIVGQCLAHQGTFYEMDHYPPGDVYDEEYFSQYYYHAHRPESGEHGHFHTFLRAGGIGEDIKPVAYNGDAKRPLGKDALNHFIAVSMNKPGFPESLFTTNRWVTDESFYAAKDAISLLDKFCIDHVYPCLVVNQWLSAMLVLFRPQIEVLLHARDRKINDWAVRHPGVDVYEDRELEITSIMAIDTTKQIAVLRDLTGQN